MKGGIYKELKKWKEKSDGIRKLLVFEFVVVERTLVSVLFLCCKT